MIGNAAMIDGKLPNPSDPMPPNPSAGPLSQEALDTWDHWFKVITKRGVVPR